MKTRLLIIPVIGNILLILMILSLSLFSLEAQFDGIKNNIEKTGYDICEIRLEKNKIIIDLNQIFEDSEPEKKIKSKIPSYFDYEIVYHEGYTDYFINTITAHECDSEYKLLNLDNIDEHIQKNENQELEGVIIDQRLGKESHEYHFFTNELSKISTGSSGIQLEGIDQMDNLDGKYVKLFGSISKKGEEIINVDKVQILYSVVPTGMSFENKLKQTSIHEIHENPDDYYNQRIMIKGELREHDADFMVHRGVGCDNARFTTSDEFVAEFISSQQLYDENDKHLGVRIGSQDNIGISKSERLPIELKNNQVEMTGIFVPAIRDMNWCDAIIYKSGYILTDFEKIKLVE